jgi:excinuclease ABC subunit A
MSMEKPQPTMFIFDEPTTGLHFHDINTLMRSFDRLLERGHTIIVIEHNMDVIKCADHVIDIGPEGGEAGGYVVATGTPEQVAACAESYTGRYLASALTM